MMMMMIMMMMMQKQPPEVFCKKGALENFVKLTGKQMCQSLFLIKLQASSSPSDDDELFLWND